MTSLKIGICGLGTVGSGVVNIFNAHHGLIEQRCSNDLQLVHIGARRDNSDCDISDYRVSRDIFEVVRDPEVDVVVELIGGTTVARDLVTQAIHAGKHVVTANKALIAKFGNELTSLAERAQVALRFEAAVAGGIPVIKVLRESLAANVVSGMAGIINGTGNFILTEMANAGRSFEDVLAEAQALGYAEADPTFDIDGTDAAHKLVILASLAFGIPLDANAAVTEGIDTVTPEDLDFAKELGFSIKHLGIARRCGDALDLRVHPTLIPTHRQIARVDGVLNAVMIEADAVGEIVLTGPGAGSLPTASSVCGDLMDLGRVLKNSPVDPVPPLGVPSDQLQTLPLIPRHEVEGVWYLRLVVEDRPGVMAEITGLLSARGISIEQLIQRPPVEGSSHVTVVILTDSAVCGHLDSAICDMESLPTLNGSVVRLRVESFKEA
jgi:homoserine dehydrogenase